MPTHCPVSYTHLDVYKRQIWKYIAELSTPGFFVTADIMYEGEEFPVDIKAFIIDKLALIETGISCLLYTSMGQPCGTG